MFEGNNLAHELLLPTRQETKLRNVFENNISTDIKLSKTLISKLSYSIWWIFLGSLLGKIAGPLTKVAVPLAKNISAPLGITVAASVIHAGIQKKIHGSGTATLITSNEEINDIIKIVQALENANIYCKELLKQFQNEIKEQKGGFLGTLLGYLGDCLLGNMLLEKNGY